MVIKIFYLFSESSDNEKVNIRHGDTRADEQTEHEGALAVSQEGLSSASVQVAPAVTHQEVPGGLRAVSTHVQVTPDRKEGEREGREGRCQDGLPVQQGEVQVSDGEEDLMIMM